MPLVKLNKRFKNKIAELLVKYFEERGMPNYNKKWTIDYLNKGHKKEIKKDEFFVYKENNKIIGVISLINDVSKLAEIRDEVVFPNYNKNYLKKMLLEIINLSKKYKLRKIYALVLKNKMEYYKVLGFKKEGLLKNHFIKGEDLTIMSKFI